MKAYFLWLAKLLTLIFIFCFTVPLLFVFIAAVASRSVGEASESLVGDRDKKVAVVEVTGVIMNSRDVIDELYKQAQDNSVRGIVLRVDSPGGAVGPSQEIYSAVSKLKNRKPIVASMGAVAASGGLYVSLGASKIYAQPGTITGSIGVIMQVPNFTDVASKIGFDMVTIKSGRLKDAGNSFRKMLPEETEYLEGTVHESHQAFIDAVAEGRKIDREKVLTFADGRIILGSRAKDLGLIDQIGDIYDASRAVFEIAGAPLADNEVPYLYYPSDKYREFRKLFESVTSIPALFSRKTELQFMLQ